MGDDAFMEQTKFPRQVFGSVHKYVGESYDEAVVEALRRERLVVNEVLQDERGLLGWKIHRKF